MFERLGNGRIHRFSRRIRLKRISLFSGHSVEFIEGRKVESLVFV